VQGLGWLVGLDSRGRGRKAKLSGAQQQALYEMVVAGPLASEAGIESYQKARFISDCQGDPAHEQARREWGGVDLAGDFKAGTSPGGGELSCR
jgi:hypothetical protein